jgi:hypothetical protein
MLPSMNVIQAEHSSVPASLLSPSSVVSSAATMPVINQPFTLSPSKSDLDGEEGLAEATRDFSRI